MGRYSLWLMPGGATVLRLAEAIDRLGRELGGPRFDPHITLLGGLEGAEGRFIAATERLAAALDPVTLQLRDIEFGEHHYRCLYLRVAERDDLMAAHQEALRQFGRPADPSFAPHVSLFYGTLLRQRRDRIAAGLSELRSVTCRAGRIRLVGTGGEPASWRVILDRALGTTHPGR